MMTALKSGAGYFIDSEMGCFSSEEVHDGTVNRVPAPQSSVKFLFA